MSPAAIIVIAVAAVVLLAAIVLVTAARRADVRGAGALSRETRRRDKDAEIDLPPARTGRAVERAVSDARHGGLVAAEPTAPVVWVPPDPEAVGVSRRQFLNRATVALTGGGATIFAAAGFVAFLWPTAKGGFGGKINVGKVNDVLSEIRAGGGFFYNATARSWVTQYPIDAVPKAKGVPNYKPLLPGMENGLVAMYQKCPHLGCRVPQCVSSQWFECPCHGSQYNRVGEKKGGPAPRGMTHFVLQISDVGDVVIDTGVEITGAPIGTNTTGQEAEGPHCIGGTGGHG
ncbi:MAG TPA: Rieske 2Fe-2S domain-containing protein [Ilumatobacteraceae bacterium]|nr:Rieske 2Fe-2S domain-containing protein [Ilumatobacteraceae bacterium]